MPGQMSSFYAELGAIFEADDPGSVGRPKWRCGRDSRPCFARFGTNFLADDARQPYRRMPVGDGNDAYLRSRLIRSRRLRCPVLVKMDVRWAWTV